MGRAGYELSFCLDAADGELRRTGLKIVIDRLRCAGHARCNAVAPTLYPLDDVGYITSDGFDVTKDMEALAQRGARACPERVIKIVIEGE
jgi:ferredoxin